MHEIWFWQRMVSPHMAHLALALSNENVKVIYVAERLISKDRQSQGWLPPDMTGVNLKFAHAADEVQDLVDSADERSVHICQGIRSNGSVSLAQSALSKRRLSYWVIMETVYDSGWLGSLKRLEYRRLLIHKKKYVKGVLAIGRSTGNWLVKRGLSPDFIYPFAYFLKGSTPGQRRDLRTPRQFRFVFVGRLVQLKRVDLLISALMKIIHFDFELLIVGSGPEEVRLRDLASRGLGNRVRWLGQFRSDEIPSLLEQSDCLVLPSIHDGWGAVVSEALIEGTPAVCSDACGAAEVVLAGGVGGVFPSGDVDALSRILEQQVIAGPVSASDRKIIAHWAKSLLAESGAQYLLTILSHADGLAKRPLPPWKSIHSVNSKVGTPVS